MTHSNALTRRSAIGIGGAAVGTAVLAACGGESAGTDDGAANPSSPPQTESGDVVAKVSDVPVGESFDAKIGDDPILVSQPKEGTFAAFSAICTHQGCVVKADGAELHCPCHGSVYDAATGEVKSGPAPEPLPKVKVTTQGNNIVTA